MKKILTVIGARPQIIKAAAISRAIANHWKNEIQEDIVHTGQHYDQNMSEVFFEELGIPKPAFNLQVGSGTHGSQTGAMLAGIEKILLEHKHDAVLVYGDTNSTLAGALAAVKIHVPLIHIEAGLRSFNKRMPEEINRIMCDHASTLLFSPTKQGISNLEKEGIKHSDLPYSAEHPGVFHCGDIMFDNSRYFAEISKSKSTIIKDLALTEQSFGLCTIHRDTNTDQPELLAQIIEGLLEITALSGKKIVLPLHPRTRNKMSVELATKLESNPHIILTEPLSFLDMVEMESRCDFVITDSGGVQKEAFFFKKPCIILREQTEWVELVSNGNAMLTGANRDKIIKAYQDLIAKESTMTWPAFFGDGSASEFICQTIFDYLHS